MVTRKYIRDYRLEDELDKRGRLRSVAVYVGAYYTYEQPALATKRAKAWLIGLHMVGWLLFLGGLCPECAAHRTAWVILPFVACMMPLAYESMAVWTLIRAELPLKREEADKLSRQLPITALITLILSGAAFIGMIVRSALNPELLQWGDALFMPMAAAMAVSQGFVLRLAGRFRTAERSESGSAAAKAAADDVIKRENG